MTFLKAHHLRDMKEIRSYLHADKFSNVGQVTISHMTHMFYQTTDKDSIHVVVLDDQLYQNDFTYPISHVLTFQIE